MSDNSTIRTPDEIAHMIGAIKKEIRSTPSQNAFGESNEDDLQEYRSWLSQLTMFFDTGNIAVCGFPVAVWLSDSEKYSPLVELVENGAAELTPIQKALKQAGEYCHGIPRPECYERSCACYRAEDFIENTTLPIIMIDNDAKLVFVNKAMEEFLGKSRHQLSNKNLIDLICHDVASEDLFTKVKDGFPIDGNRVTFKTEKGLRSALCFADGSFDVEGGFINTRCICIPLSKISDMERKRTPEKLVAAL